MKHFISHFQRSRVKQCGSEVSNNAGKGRFYMIILGAGGEGGSIVSTQIWQEHQYPYIIKSSLEFLGCVDKIWNARAPAPP